LIGKMHFADQSGPTRFLEYMFDKIVDRH
jgi:hypothetical protein